MRSLSSTLLAAQKSASRLPYVRVEVVDRVAGVTRLDWARLYTGSEPDFFHAAAIAGDGSLIRARVDNASYQLYRQRVASPGPGSNFGSWIAAETVSDVSGIALAASGSSVLLFYVGTDQKTIYVRESADNGASFGSAVSITTAASPVGWLAAAFNGSGMVALFYSVGGTVYAVKRTGGSWGSPSAWSHSLSDVSGLACVYQGDWNLAVCGMDSSSSHRVWTVIYGDGYSQSPGTWSSLKEITMASPDSSVEFRAPSLTYPDVFRLFFVEKYTGSQSYSRPFWSHSLATAEFNANLWREPVPFDLACSYGMAIAWGGGYAWLSTPSGVWRAALSPALVELTGDVLRLVLVAEPTSGKVVLELRNDDGRYNQPGVGSYAPIKLGSELKVSPGYRTTAGNEVSAGPTYWIEGWEHVSEASSARFILEAGDGWGLLEKWRARRQFSWSAGSRNVFQLLSLVLARAGLEFASLGSSTLMTNFYPAFAIHPGESGAQAVRRLLGMVPDVLFFRGNFGYVKNPQSGDAADYSYGTDHAILAGRYRSSGLGVNRVQVFGSGLMVEGFAWEELNDVYDHLRQVHDLNLDTVTLAEQRAEAELRREATTAPDGEILVPPNCGQELYDVVNITDSRAGLSSAKRRGLGMRLSYVAQAARYEQRLSLGGV